MAGGGSRLVIPNVTLSRPFPPATEPAATRGQWRAGGIGETMHRARASALGCRSERGKDISGMPSRSPAGGELRPEEEQLRLALEAGEIGAWEWELASGRMQW